MTDCNPFLCRQMEDYFTLGRDKVLLDTNKLTLTRNSGTAGNKTDEALWLKHTSWKKYLSDRWRTKFSILHSEETGQIQLDIDELTHLPETVQQATE